MTARATDDDVDPRVERTRERVVAAVLDLLETQGLDGVTHTRVAEHAGVGRATLYRHWPEQHDLLAEALHAHQREVAGLEAASRLETLPSVARHVARSFAEALRTDPLLPAMLGMLERAERDPSYAMARASLAQTGAGPLRGALERARSAEHVPADLDDTLAVAGLLGPLFFARFALTRPYEAEEVDRHVDRWLGTIGYTGPVSEATSDR